MSNNTLGISYGHHDSAAVLVDSKGQILFASQEERFSGIKHDYRFPVNVINHINKYYDIDNVAIFNKESSFWARLEDKKQIKNSLGKLPIESYNHHDTHAMSSIGMNFKEPGAVLVIDTQGAKKATSLGYWDGKKLTWLKEFYYPNSVGLFYSAVTKFVGLKPLNDENIVMSAADFGKPVFKDAIKESIFDPRTKSGKYQLIVDEKSLNRLSSKGTKTVNFDVCASAQYILNECVTNLAYWLANETKSKTLYYSGGVAFNCVTNTNLYKWFKHVYINPAAGDAGCAMGAAWMDKTNPYFEHPYLGYNVEVSEDQIENWVKTIDYGGIAMVIGGRAEWGPRALGNRSLLCRPTEENIKKLNYIKQRNAHSWRPYAPVGFTSLIKKHYTVGDRDGRFMLNVFPAKKSNNPIYPTGRVQTVDERSNQLIGKILSLYYLGDDDLEDYLINTSFNQKGKPIPNQLSDLDADWYRNVRDFLNI